MSWSIELNQWHSSDRDMQQVLTILFEHVGVAVMKAGVVVPSKAMSAIENHAHKIYMQNTPLKFIVWCWVYETGYFCDCHTVTLKHSS